VQGDPEDGLLYNVKQGIAIIVLCSLPGSTNAKRITGIRSNVAAPQILSSEQEAPAALADEDQDGQIPKSNSHKWKVICKALSQHCFRVPGVISWALELLASASFCARCVLVLFQMACCWNAYACVYACMSCAS
jgi:hypothetical protein